MDTIDYNKIPFEILEVENIGIKCFSEMSLRYHTVELNTAVKPYYFQYFFNSKYVDTIIYLDPDIQIFAPLNELEEELKINDIVITPHFTTPLNDNKWQAEEDFLNSGLYNLGFIAVKSTTTSRNMIDWWAQRLRNKSYIDQKRGLFTDQIWINFVPLFFEKVKIFTNVGYNVAYWNLHERVISYKNGAYYVNEKQPLVFFHYASYKPLNPTIISTGQTRFTFEERPDIVPLFKGYCELILKNNYIFFNNFQCYFAKVKEKIENDLLVAKISKVPLYKKVIGKILREIIKRLNIMMDYNTLRKEIIPRS